MSSWCRDTRAVRFGGEDPLRCSKCDSDNPEGAKFCIDCAAPLANSCPKCGQENLPRAKFCADCATPVIAAAPKSKVQPESTPSRVSPEEAVANEADGERKTVTALFADIKGSTELMRDLDPEEARRLVDPALKLMMDAVHRYTEAFPRLGEQKTANLILIWNAGKHDACQQSHTVL